MADVRRRLPVEGRSVRHGSALLATIALLLGTAVAASSCRANDLIDTYRLAYAHDPVLAAADALRGSAHAQADAAAGALRPQASATGSWMRDRASGAGEPVATDRRTEVSLAVNQVLFDAGLSAQRGAADAQAESQDATWRAATQALALRVADAYVGVLVAADALATARANESAYDQQVAQSEARVKQRLVAQVDVDQARTYQALAHAGTVAARQALADAKGVLAEITGTWPGDLHGLRAELPLGAPAPADPAAWEARAAGQNPSVLAARAQLAAAERSIDGARAGHLPTLSAGLGVGRPALTPAADGSGSGRLTTTLGLTLNVPLFAGGATQARVRDAVYRRDGAQDALEQQRRAAVRAAQEAYRGVVDGAERVVATRAAVDAARRALDATRVGYDVGTRTVTDLLLAIQSLGQAQDASSQARHQLVLSRLRLAQAAGTLDEADLAAVDGLLV
jgi:outer membrane protein